jgi:hypothetical protein
VNQSHSNSSSPPWHPTNSGNIWKHDVEALFHVIYVVALYAFMP